MQMFWNAPITILAVTLAIRDSPLPTGVIVTVSAVCLAVVGLVFRRGQREVVEMCGETMVGLNVMSGILVAMLIRQRRVYRTYQNAQQQALDRQAEVMALLRESL